MSAPLFRYISSISLYICPSCVESGGHQTLNARLDASKTLKVASSVDIGKAANYLVPWHSLQQLPFEQLLRLPAVATFSSQRQRCCPHAIYIICGDRFTVLDCTATCSCSSKNNNIVYISYNIYILIHIDFPHQQVVLNNSQPCLRFSWGLHHMNLKLVGQASDSLDFSIPSPQAVTITV